jgi:hypothetical protein
MLKTILLACAVLVAVVTSSTAGRRLSNGESVAKVELEYYHNCKDYIHNCVFHSVSLETISYAKLDSALEPFLKNSNSSEDEVVFIGLHIKESYRENSELNYFFAERPSLDIVYLHSLEGNTHNWGIVMRLVPARLGKILNTFTSFYFPSKEGCASKPIAVDMDKWSTWGNGYFTTSLRQSHVPEAIFATYIPDHCKHHNGNRFAAHRHCPNEGNKFECVFLPSTNCSIPQVLVDCEVSHKFREDLYYFPRATSDAPLMTEREYNAWRDASETVKNNPKLMPLLQAVQYSVNSKFNVYHIKDVDNVTNNTLTIDVHQGDFLYYDYFAVIFMSGIRFRESIPFRMKMQEVMRQSRTSSHFGIWKPQDKCVVFHMRKDDRMIPGYEGKMKEWCRNHTNFAVKDREKAASGMYKGQPIGYGQWMDFGCLYHLPYGDASLEHYFNASLAMFPDIKNFFVMTDDPAWLDYHTERVLGIKNISSHSSSTTTSSTSDRSNPVDANYKDIRVFTLASKRIQEGVGGSDLYQANVEFWASIELARQCQGLIIHSGSAVARIIALSLCYRSNGVRYLHCPDVFDISGDEIIFDH